MKKLILATILTGLAFASIASILPPDELKMASEVAKQYNLTPEQTALLYAIRRHENGKVGFEFGVINQEARKYADRRRSFIVQAKWTAGSIKRRYNGDLAAFSHRWCPDDEKNWRKSVAWFMSKQGYKK